MSNLTMIQILPSFIKDHNGHYGKVRIVPLLEKRDKGSCDVIIILVFFFSSQIFLA
jgi:hypothetical protein